MHSRKHFNETVDKEWLAWQAMNITDPSYYTGDAKNVKYVRIGQMNTFLGVGTAAKFKSGAYILQFGIVEEILEVMACA